MLRGMMKFEFLPDTAGLGWLKRFIQGRDIVSIQVVAYKDNLVRIGKILVHKLLDFLRPVRLAAMLSDGDSSPALMGCREHETAASTVADVFVVNLFRMVFIGQMDCFTGNRSEAQSVVRPCRREDGEGLAAWSTPPGHPPYGPQTRRSGQEEYTTSSSSEVYTGFF